MEAFIALIARAEERGQIHGVRVAPSAPSISTLCFADDTIIFFRATEEEAGVLKQILDLYATASGQVINFEKSFMTFSSGVSPGRRDQIVATLGVNVVDRHDQYLGMPAVVGKSKEKKSVQFLKRSGLVAYPRMGREISI